MSQETPPIELHQLTKRYLRHLALDAIDLTISNGCAFALLGRNGAGKSTLIRILMDLVRATKGEVRVFGRKPADLGEDGKARIGYVADGQDLPLWMKVEEYLAFLEPLYPTWDRAFCKKLLLIFDLPPKQKLRHLSRGQLAKAAFLGALAHHPKLLILDEPFGGLDPVVREEIIAALIQLMNREEWTIFVSSHEIDEVERLADRVAIMDRGKFTVCEEKDKLLGRCRAVSVLLPADPPPASSLPTHWWNP